MRSKAAGWMVFFGCLLLISFAGTSRYSKTTDLTLISVRLGLLVVLSILLVREQWAHGREPQTGGVRGKSDAGASVLQRLRRWYHDGPQ